MRREERRGDSTNSQIEMKQPPQRLLRHFLQICFLICPGTEMQTVSLPTASGEERRVCRYQMGRK